jgi:lipopolysaccharide/colanic/teichoic acid biosynthesis glycosyltransferase
LEKRVFDILFAALGLILFSPFLMIICCCIKMGDGGPVFYRGERVGLNERLFRIFKFRTMVVDAERYGGSSTADDDPRITSVGRFLRKYKLDELPQLINVLKGDMSIVGPRPEVKYYTDTYTAEEKTIISIRPGITDWASIWNSDEGRILAGAEDPEKVYREVIRPTKLKLQMRYVKEQSLMKDFQIIILTLRAMASPTSRAFEEIIINKKEWEQTP